MLKTIIVLTPVKNGVLNAIFTYGLNLIFRCPCINGYRELDRFQCQDIDECFEGTHKCDNINGACENLDVSKKFAENVTQMS